MNDFMTKVASQSMNRIALFSLIAAAIYFFTIYDSGALIEQQIATLKAQVDVETGKKSETEKILKKEEQMRADVALLAKTYEEVKAKIPIEFDVYANCINLLKALVISNNETNLNSLKHSWLELFWI